MKGFVTSARALIKMASVYEGHRTILQYSEKKHTEKNTEINSLVEVFHFLKGSYNWKALPAGQFQGLEVTLKKLPNNFYRILKLQNSPYC